MPVIYTFVIPPALLPFVGPAGILIGAVLGIGGTLLTQRWRNNHEVRLKQLDFQQKEIERLKAKEDAFLKQKSDAADHIIKKLSLRLQYLDMNKNFFEDILNANSTEDVVSINARFFSGNLAEVFNKHSEAQLPSIQSFHTFFDEDINLDEQEAQIRQRDNQFEEVLATFYRTMDTVIGLYQGMQNAADGDTPDEFEKISTQHSAAVLHLLELAQRLLALTRDYIRLERTAIMFIRKQKAIVTPF